MGYTKQQRDAYQRRRIVGVQGYAAAFPVDNAPCQKPNVVAQDALQRARLGDDAERIAAAEAKRARRAMRNKP